MIDATIKCSRLKEWIECLMVILDEAVMHVTLEGIETCMVDPGHVSQVRTVLAKADFDKYTASEGIVALDLSKLHDLLKLPEKDAMIRIQYSDKGRVKIEWNVYRRLLTVLSDTTPGKPTRLTRMYRAEIMSNYLKVMLAGADKVTDHFMMCWNTDGKMQMIAKGETDSFEANLTRDQIPNSEPPDHKQKAEYSIEILMKMMQHVPNNIDIKMEMKTDFPMSIQFPMSDSVSDIVYIIAPRIENDKDPEPVQDEAEDGPAPSIPSEGETAPVPKLEPMAAPETKTTGIRQTELPILDPPELRGALSEPKNPSMDAKKAIDGNPKRRVKASS